jgi:hypothetical protein
MSYSESIEEEKWKLRHFFTRKELRSAVVKNPVTIESLITKHQQIHFRERYLSFPGNLIQPKQIVALIKSK